MKNKKVKLMAMALAVVLMIGAAAQAETLGAVGAAAQTADETLSVADIYERASGSVVQVRGMAANIRRTAARSSSAIPTAQAAPWQTGSARWRASRSRPTCGGSMRWIPRGCASSQ